MSERNVIRPWSEEEDTILKRAVAYYGDNDQWKAVAAMVQTRTNKACRKRWLHSLAPDVKKSSWTAEEDDLLLQLHARLGPKWSAIARSIPGRTDDACSKRYREALDPSLKKSDWTPEEDQKLTEVYSRIGPRWKEVSQELERGSLACRNRWRLLERKRAALLAQSSPPAPPVVPMVEDMILPSNIFQLQPESHLLQTSPIQAPIPSLTVQPVMDAPYIPREAYPPMYHTDDASWAYPSCDSPEPEPLVIPAPDVAFHHSSSSLGAALTDSASTRARPLPPQSVENTPDLVQEMTLSDPDIHSWSSPLSQPPLTVEMNDNMMLLDVTASPHMLSFSHEYNDTTLNNTTDYNYCSASPLSFTADIARPTMTWKTRTRFDTDFTNSPNSVFSGMSDGQDDVPPPSVVSTPFSVSTPLPVASPQLATHVDLPVTSPNGQPSSGSLLFSPANKSHVQPSQTTLFLNTSLGNPTTTTSLTRTNSKTSHRARLSSQLAASKGARPYACGHPICWPKDAEIGNAVFSTSGALVEHWKMQHGSETPSPKPFRCALAGCDKGWKTINGLQYHLQISVAHYSQALSSRISESSPAIGEEAELDDPDGKRRFTCPVPGCYKAYRQPSGLRYHTKWGHPARIPTQLDEVPPALELQLPTKVKKLRIKALTEPTAQTAITTATATAIATPVSS